MKMKSEHIQNNDISILYIVDCAWMASHLIWSSFGVSVITVKMDAHHQCRVVSFSRICNSFNYFIALYFACEKRISYVFFLTARIHIVFREPVLNT